MHCPIYCWVLHSLSVKYNDNSTNCLVIALFFKCVERHSPFIIVMHMLLLLFSSFSSLCFHFMKTEERIEVLFIQREVKNKWTNVSSHILFVLEGRGFWAMVSIVINITCILEETCNVKWLRWIMNCRCIYFILFYFVK